MSSANGDRPQADLEIGEVVQPTSELSFDVHIPELARMRCKSVRSKRGHNAHGCSINETVNKGGWRQRLFGLERFPRDGHGRELSQRRR